MIKIFEREILSVCPYAQANFVNQSQPIADIEIYDI